MSERVIRPSPKKEEMCENCGGKISEGKITVKHWYDGRLVIIEDVPVGICQFCSERYYEADTVDKLDIIAKERGASPRKTVGLSSPKGVSKPASVVSFETYKKEKESPTIG